MSPDPYGYTRATYAGNRPDKYTYSTIIKNLPETWARKSTTVQRNFLAMMTSYTQVMLHSPTTSETHATCIKEDGRRYFYAFVSAYSKEEDANCTPLEESPEIALHDRTKVVFPIDLDSEESVVPPNYDSDGNEIREEDWDHEQNSDSTGLVPPDYDSDGNKFL